MLTTKNNILMLAFILVTVLATARSAEAEITMEAAFQGHCGHTSPCEQLCYEIHDGMYECDCIEGYELNKNGYSCQVINSTSGQDGHSKSDEDVLYQKGASFSAKLANDNTDDNHLSSSYSSSSALAEQRLASSSAAGGSSSGSAESGEEEQEDNEDASIYLNEDLGYAIAQQQKEQLQLQQQQQEQQNHHDQHQQQQKHDEQHYEEVNLQDYYISNESGSSSNNARSSSSNINGGGGSMDSVDFDEEYNGRKYKASNVQQTKKYNPKHIPTTYHPSTISRTTLEMPQAMALSGNNMDDLDDYYVRQQEDMSIYDDVNNNQLNLRSIQQTTYQQQQQQQQQQYKQNDQEDHAQISNHNTIKVNDNNNKNHNKFKNYNNNNNYVVVTASSAQSTKPATATNNVVVVGSSSSSSSSDADKISANISYVISSKGTTNNEICNLDCGIDGLCDNSDGRSRCLCPFGKTGIHCVEDIKTDIPKFKIHSWLAFPALRGAYKHVQLRVEFRPESFDGIILLSGERDDLTGDFMALLLNKGFVEFWFDCGSGPGSVRSRETILLNEWNSVVIYRHRWDAWLVLNHGSKVQGRSNGLFSRITFREPVFLGGTGNITHLSNRLPISQGFVGCIRRFVANEHDYKFEEHPVGDVTKGFDIQNCITDKCSKYPCQHGGKCLPSDQGAVCLCPMGFVGDLCEIRMDLQVPSFNGSSYLRYAPLQNKVLIWLELKVILKPEQPDGLILYSGPKRHGDFIALYLVNNYVEFTFDLGSGPAVVRSEYPLNLGQWHTIRISRTARLAIMKIDQHPEVMTISTNGFWHLYLPENLFVGGVNHVDKLPLDMKNKPFFMGCIQRIDINGRSLGIISEALGGTNVGNCPHACVAKPCGPLAECIPQMESYECRCNVFNEECKKEAETLAKKKQAEQQQQLQQQHTTSQQQQTASQQQANLENIKNKNLDNKPSQEKDMKNSSNMVKGTSNLWKIKDKWQQAHKANHKKYGMGHGVGAGGKQQPQQQQHVKWYTQQQQLLHKNKQRLKPTTTTTTTSTTTTTTTTTPAPMTTSTQKAEPLMDWQNFNFEEDTIKQPEQEKFNTDDNNDDTNDGTYEGEDITDDKVSENQSLTQDEDESEEQQSQQNDDNEENLSNESDDEIEDDIIFRDIKEMYKQLEQEHQLHNEELHMQQQRAYKANLQRMYRNKRKHRNDATSTTTTTTERSTKKLHSTQPKLDPHHKTPIIDKPQHKLSRLPTHYESFQTNTGSDILTFDDPTALEEQWQNFDQPESQSQQEIESQQVESEETKQKSNENNFGSDETDDGEEIIIENSSEQDTTKEEEKPISPDIKVENQHKTEPEKEETQTFTINDSLFDESDGTEEYQRKQLAQDMKRIMSNTKGPYKPKTPKLVITEYDYISEEQNNNDDDNAENREPSTTAKDNPAIELKLQQQQEESELQSLSTQDDTKQLDDFKKSLDSEQQEELLAEKKLPVQQSQPHTDWSLLSKFDLPTDEKHQPIGVHKSFGACFAGHDSYFHYNDAETMQQIISNNIDLNLRIKTRSDSGVILWTGSVGSTNRDFDDYLLLGIEDGYLHFRYNLGSGEVDIRFNATKLGDGLWHRVRAIRNAQEGYVEIDGRKSSSMRSPGKLRQLNTDTGLYVGGMPDVNYFTRRRYTSGIVGCISEIVLAGELKMSFDPNTLGTSHNVETGIL